MVYKLIYLDIFFNSYFFERFLAGNLNRIQKFDIIKRNFSFSAG